MRLSNALQIPVTTARILLQHFKWDRERLIERYYGSGDIDKIFEEAHCVKPDAALAGAGAAVDEMVSLLTCIRVDVRVCSWT